MQAVSDPERDRDQANDGSAEDYTKRSWHVSVMRSRNHDGKNGGRHGCLNDQHGL